MLKLSPVMSWMFMVFQSSVVPVSPPQTMRHVAPSLKMSPGPGSLGVGTARATSAAARTVKAVNGANIALTNTIVREDRCWAGGGEVRLAEFGRLLVGLLLLKERRGRIKRM